MKMTNMYIKVVNVTYFLDSSLFKEKEKEKEGRER
jgi:hypothetical protein